MAALVDNSFDNNFPIFLTGGAIVQLFLTMVVAVWDLRPRRHRLLLMLFVHFLLLLALVVVLPVVAEISLDSTYSHYQISAEEAGGFNFGPEGWVLGALMMFGIALFLIYEFTSFVIRLARVIRSAPSPTGALAKENS
jgi:hypothetical protein